MSVQSEAPRKIGLVALISAWVVTLSVVAALAGYALWGGTPLPGPSEQNPQDESTPTATQREDNAPPTTADAQTAQAPSPQDTAVPATPPENSPAAAEASSEPLTGQQDTEVSEISKPTPAVAAPAANTLGTAALSPTGRGPGLTEGSGPPWQRFSRPYDKADDRPRIAIVVTGLGLSTEFTKAAIELLPPEVTLSFSPYAMNLKTWVESARENGHEIMIDLPMEPLTYPDDDPGPLTLLTALPNDENLSRLEAILGKGEKFVGLAGYKGSRFSSTREKMRPILDSLKDKGLLYLDNHPVEKAHAAKLAGEVGVPRAINNRLLDAEPASARTIDSRLAYTERIAQQEGVAVAMARPYPITIKNLLAWSKDLSDRGIALAPLTAVADQQSLR